ncbi:MAG: trimethylamine methyltransferase family protein [Chloroflexi bacterium]|nr:trimethylamine methyltransferase family protein [Chloroflexota bacterium]
MDTRLLVAPDPVKLDRLHAAALQILERTGIQADTEEARELFRRGGAAVDGARVRFPPKLVEWAVSVAPRTYTIYDRLGRKAYTVGADEVVFNTGTAGIAILDWQTGRVRPYSRADAVEGAKLSDVLPQICDVSVTGMMQDVPPEIAERLTFVIRYESSIKPMAVLSVRTPGMFEKQVEIIARDLGGLDQLQKYPCTQAIINTQSPLALPPEECDRLMSAARLGIPTGASAWPQIGATSPVTVAGTVALAHAEHLASLVLVQLVRAGTRFYYGGSAPVFDMRALVCSTGAPERALGALTLMQLGRHIGLPVRSNCITTDAKGVNVQAGVERTIQALACCLGGATMVGGLGWLDNINVMSHEMLILDCELVDALRHFLPGLAFDEDDLGLDTIDAVGPYGSFMGEAHTFARFRTEVWYPSVWLRSPALARQPEDDERLRQRIHDKLQNALASHRPPKLAPQTRQALDDFVAAPVAAG